jgi:hypothetical protein
MMSLVVPLPCSFKSSWMVIRPTSCPSVLSTSLSRVSPTSDCRGPSRPPGLGARQRFDWPGTETGLDRSQRWCVGWGVRKSRNVDLEPQSPRMLRVGLVLGGTIIDEILIRERETVTLGQSVHNHLCVPVDGIPKSLPLFEVVDGRYQLRVIGAMDGRLSSGGKVQTLEQLKQQSARNEKDEWVLPLSDSARGKLSLGPMTLLFQFVSARPVPPKPKLPASVRQSLVNRVEPRLALILAGSVFVHFAVGTWAYTRDRSCTDLSNALRTRFRWDSTSRRLSKHQSPNLRSSRPMRLPLLPSRRTSSRLFARVKAPRPSALTRRSQ